MVSACIELSTLRACMLFSVRVDQPMSVQLVALNQNIAGQHVNELSGSPAESQSYCNRPTDSKAVLVLSIEQSPY